MVEHKAARFVEECTSIKVHVMVDHKAAWFVEECANLLALSKNEMLSKVGNPNISRNFQTLYPVEFFYQFLNL